MVSNFPLEIICHNAAPLVDSFDKIDTAFVLRNKILPPVYDRVGVDLGNALLNPFFEINQGLDSDVAKKVRLICEKSVSSRFDQDLR